MGRGCFGLLIGLLSITLLAGSYGCSQAERQTATADTTNVAKEKEDSGCCGGCCGEETSETNDECCGKCEQESQVVAKKECCGKCKGETEVVAKKECCGKCQDETKSLTSATAKTDAKACEYCKGEKACEECQKQATSLKESKETKACEHCKGEEACEECKKSQTGKVSVNSMKDDRDVFHYLLKNHSKISRKVTVLENGVKTVTESDDPAIAGKIQEHVLSMKKRVEQRRPLRMWDELFQEIFKHADKIEMKVKKTAKGAEVIETSSDSYVAKLIKEHAKVVSGFAERGFEEAHENHAPPKK